MRVHTSGEFLIDLNNVRDGSRVVVLVGSRGAQLTPVIGDVVAATDEDEYTYDAIVEDVLADGRVYLRVAWATQRRSASLGAITHHDEMADTVGRTLASATR